MVKILQVLEMTKSECVHLLCAYPVIVAQHFNHRFLNYILKGNGNPIGEVVTFGQSSFNNVALHMFSG